MEPERELKLRLSGRTLAFPGGAPWCLVCGRRPFGLRTAAFKDPDYASRRTEGANLVLQRIHPLLAWANRARLVTFKVEAPVCFRHYWRGRGAEVAGLGLFALALGGFLWLGLKGRLPDHPGEMGSLLKGFLVVIVTVPGFLLWRWRRKSPLLPCDARRETPEELILVYPGRAPRPRSPGPIPAPGPDRDRQV
ncbi:MAG TPA: hypothetical protein VEN81_05865 [Planctomycetota bacterium]|jgi:hypothetical protein|nr:hypothetical protein [Planctomycetota bacterium]